MNSGWIKLVDAAKTNKIGEKDDMFTVQIGTLHAWIPSLVWNVLSSWEIVSVDWRFEKEPPTCVEQTANEIALRGEIYRVGESSVLLSCGGLILQILYSAVMTSSSPIGVGTRIEVRIQPIDVEMCF